MRARRSHCLARGRPKTKYACTQYADRGGGVKLFVRISSDDMKLAKPLI